MSMTTEAKREYQREWNRGWRLRNGAVPRPARPYDFAAALDVALARVDPALSGSNRVGAAYVLLGVTRETARRWRAGGIDGFTADRIAIRLGLHPALIWGAEWYAEAAS